MMLVPEIIWAFWHLVPAILLATVRNEDIRTVAAATIALAWLLSLGFLLWADLIQTLWINSALGLIMSLVYTRRHVWSGYTAGLARGWECQ
jgi:hypothetical protein